MGCGGGGLVDDAELHPDGAGPEADGVLDDGGDLVGGSEKVDHVERGGVVEGGNDGGAVDGGAGEGGVDADDVEALGDEEGEDVVAGAVGLVRGADHGDAAGGCEDGAYRVGVVVSFWVHHRCITQFRPYGAAR